MAPELRVLVVEDEEETRLLSAALLEGRRGLTLCGLARDGLEGLALVERTRPDAVLLDLILPGLDGLGFLRALGRGPGRPVVVVASQASDPALIRMALKLGASHYLIKPVNFDILPELFRSLCLGPRVQAARACLEGMGASGLGLEAAAYTAAVLSAAPAGAAALKEGYAAAMSAQGASYVCVEKNIRAMVDRLHKRKSGPYAALMGGLPDQKPSNEAFLRRLAEKILED